MHNINNISLLTAMGITLAFIIITVITTVIMVVIQGKPISFAQSFTYIAVVVDLIILIILKAKISNLEDNLLKNGKIIKDEVAYEYIPEQDAWISRDNKKTYNTDNLMKKINGKYEFSLESGQNPVVEILTYANDKYYTEKYIIKLPSIQTSHMESMNEMK